jgi:hypothetical protein
MMVKRRVVSVLLWVITVAIDIPLKEAFTTSHVHSKTLRILPSPPLQRQQQRPQHHLSITELNAQHQGNHCDNLLSDRMRRQTLGLLFGIAGMFSHKNPVEAIITDETDAFANTAPDSSYRGLTTPRSSVARPYVNTPQSQAPTSDEITIAVPKKEISKGLGIELGEVQFQTAVRVYVKSIEPGSTAQRAGIQKDWIFVSVNGQSVERTNGEGVAIVVYRATKATPEDGTIQFVFRDPAVFQQRLRNMGTQQQPETVVTTQLAPEGETMTKFNRDGSIQASPGVDTRQTDQRLTVAQLVPPKICNRGATTGDLLEVAYLGTVVETGATFDGSAIRINGEGIPGRGNDVSLFFVLGKQPMGQFPPGWDVGLEGMCVVSE